MYLFYDDVASFKRTEHDGVVFSRGERHYDIANGENEFYYRNDRNKYNGRFYDRNAANEYYIPCDWCDVHNGSNE